MPGFALHQGAQVMCLHGGQATPTVPNPRVKVSGQPVVTQPPPWTVSGCALVGTTAPPCITAQWITASTKVFANGQPLLLFDSRATCSPSGQPLQVMTTQMRVKAM